MTGALRSGQPPLGCEEVRELAAPFVLGALEVDEADAVRAHLASCPEPHPEYQESADAASMLAAVVPLVEPPAALGARIRAAAEADLAVRRQSTVSGSPPRALGRPAPSRAWGLRIAAVLALALLGGWNLLLQAQLDQVQRYQRDVAAVLDVAGQPGSSTAILAAEGGGPSGLAAVAADGSVVLAVRGLQPTTGTAVYEAWLIGEDGVPRALGGFTVDATGTATFRADGVPAAEGVTLALTREPGPGATTPTLPIVTLGTTTSRG